MTVDPADLPDESESVGMYRVTFDALIRTLAALANTDKRALDALLQLARDPMVERDRYASEALDRIGGTLAVAHGGYGRPQ